MPRFPICTALLAMCVAGPAVALAPVAVPTPETVHCATGAEPIETAGYVPIGDIEQWVTISGARCGNPVVVFVHGGPGNPLSPYAASVYGGWRDGFTLVQWDQRGAGRTFARHPASEDTPLTIERMTQDGIDVVEHVAARLGQRKVILLGGSWGSALGVHMVKARPDLFHAYVGVGQLVERTRNLGDSVRAVAERARAANDAETLAAIDALGPPPWANPRHFGTLRRITRRYEAKVTVPAPDGWWAPAPAYATPEALAAYEAGEEYSYLQFVGLDGNGLLARVDLPALGPRFDVPVFLLQGEEDLVTTPAVARRYFDTIEAPEKAFILIPRTGHDPNAAMIEAEYRVLTTHVLPTLRRAVGGE